MSTPQEQKKPAATGTHRLNAIYFYLSKGCNLRCRHCWIAPEYQTKDKPHPALDLALYKDIIAQALPLGLQSVKLTGGEPFLHPRIYEILEFTRNKNLRLNIETNGVLCTAELAKEIAKSQRPFVSVSIDGPDAKTHEWVRNVAGCFEEAKMGIKNLVAAGIRPELIMSLMKYNKRYIAAVVELAASLGAGSVKFNIVLPIARGKRLAEEGGSLEIREILGLGQWIEGILSAATRLRLFYSWPPAFRPLGKMFGTSGDGCARCGILGIIGVLGDGAYALCGIGETVPELIFGQAQSDRLEEVWNNSSVLQDIRRGLPHHLEGICSMCVMKNICLGHCVAHTYYQKRNLYAPFWICEEASKRGLFPKSRINPVEEKQGVICRHMD